MLVRTCVVTALVAVTCATSFPQRALPALKPYPLPSGVQHAVNELAAEADVLVLGETHGTREVSEVAAALLAPLAQLGYRALAVEVPKDQQASLTAWATGETSTVPSFFAQPWEDGRGSIEALTLIRTALSGPFGWKLICFDVTGEDLRLEMTDGIESDQMMIAFSLRRDALMAANLSAQLRQLGPHAKALAICGDLHARTANHPGPDKPYTALWPSLAAVLQSDDPGLRVRSIRIRPQSGAFFNGGKVHTFTEEPLERAIAIRTPEGDWTMVLRLPYSTPATFLTTPSNNVAPAAPAKPGGGGRMCNCPRPWGPRHRRGRCRCTCKRR